MWPLGYTAKPADCNHIFSAGRAVSGVLAAEAFGFGRTLEKVILASSSRFSGGFRTAFCHRKGEAYIQLPFLFFPLDVM